MKLNKEQLKRIIKEELEAVMNEAPPQEAMNMAYFNYSMKDRFELQYGSKKVDFMYRYAGNSGSQIKKAIQSLADVQGKTIGSIPNLAEAILFHLEKGGMKDDKPTLEQLKNMPVYSK